MNRISGIVILLALTPILLHSQPTNLVDANEMAILNQLTRPRLSSLGIVGAYTQLEQDGVRNTTTIKQIADFNENNILLVSQQGSFNYTDIFLSKSRSFVYSEQIGNQNFLAQKFINAYNNEIYINQLGNLNQASIKSEGTLNDVYIEMTGDNNKIGDARKEGLNLKGNSISTNILQSGINNMINIKQEGSFINSSFSQLGSYNEMDIQQKISKSSNDYCNLGVNQEGFSNQVILEQQAGNSSVVVEQMGKKNYYNGTLNNQGVQGIISQIGNNNRAVQNISGYGHQYNIHQEGNNNLLIQLDNNNSPTPYRISQIGSGMKMLLRSEGL